MRKCSSCREEITTPVCVHCLEQEVIAWLQDYFPNKPELRFKVMDITDDLVMGSHPIKDNCLLCKGATSICRDCYVEEIARWLANTFSLLVPSFISTFASKAPVERVIVQIKPLPKIRSLA